ncbi:HEAT repeat-containing protein 1-like isoform X2 [Tachypleus tridentatus]|uniref:HEAT repeat-containing protein 1-like isoform X2 n=1 Tax=Tachypleus tridentatus TaxID=6853 RepID=UPI003FCF9EAF
MQGFVCLLVIFQYQNLRRFPRLGFLALCSKDVIGSLEHLCHEYHLGPILRPFFQKLVPASLSETAKSVKKRRLLSSLIKTVDLEGKEASFLVRLILQYFMKMYTKDVGRAQKQKHLIKVNLQKPSRSQKWQNPLIKKAGLLLQRLERRYPVCFDQAVGKFIQDVPTKKRVVVQKLLNNFSGSKHKLLPGGSANLYLGLNHPNDNIRMLAVETLACEVSERNKKKSDLDVEFISENLQSRLADESPIVVAKVLKYRKVLTTYLSDDDITPILMNIVKKQPNNNHRKWCQVRAKALELLFTKSTRPGAGHTKLFIDVLPLIVAVNNHEINLAKSVLQSSLASSHSLLHGIWEESKAGDTFVDFSRTVLQLLGQNVEQMETSDKETMVESLLGAIDGEDTTMKYLVCQLLSCAFVSPFSLNKKVEASYKIVVSFSNWLKEEKIFTEDKMETDEQKELELNLRALRKQKLPLSAILKCLGSIIQGVECGEHLKERSWFVPGSSVTESLLLQLFYLVTELAASCKGAMKQRSQKLLMDFFKYQLGEPEVLGKFMSSLWCFDLLLLHEDVLLKSVVQVRSLYISATLYTASKKHVEHILKNSSTVFPCLLVALTSQLEPVRLAAALCLQKLGEYCGDADNTPYGRLTQHLVNHTEEIIVDSRQLPIVLSKWFAPAVKENDSSTRLRPSTRSAATTHLSTEATTLKILLELVVDTSTPAHIQHGLLRVLQCVNSQDCLGKLLPLLDSMLEPYFNDKDLILKHSQYAIVEQILSKFTSENAELFCKEKSQALQLLKKMLLSSIRVNCGMDSLHLMALKVLTKEFFQALGSPIVQHELLDLVLDLYVNSTSAHDGKAMTKVIKKMCFDGKLLVKVLHQVETSATTKTVRDVKKQRTQTSSPEVENVLDKQPWKKVIVLLEIVQSRSKLQAVETLIPALFDLLKRSLEVGNGPDKHYLQQVILSCLYTCVQQVMSSEDGDNRETSVKLREEHFQVELIVQVIRVSENPQTQNQALLLLNLIACRFSEHVLHNIIAIFTFMGASLVRQDNSYSFQVISQTIETIIPALLETSNQTGTTDETQKTVSMVTRVFVDAVLDVPQHRRLPVFSKLIHTLGPKQYLWIPLGQVFDQHITKQPVQGPAEEKVQGTLPLWWNLLSH